MLIVPHVERQFTDNETIRDIVIGMSDGLTVPFAMAAGIPGKEVVFFIHNDTIIDYLIGV